MEGWILTILPRTIPSRRAISNDGSRDFCKILIPKRNLESRQSSVAGIGIASGLGTVLGSFNLRVIRLSDFVVNQHQRCSRVSDCGF